MGLNATNICEIVSPAGRIKVEDAELSAWRTNFGADNVLVIENDTDDGAAVLPQVTSIEVMDERTIRVLFDKQMPTNTTLGVMAGGNYSISGPGKGTLSTTPGMGVAHISGGTLFELTWDEDEEMVDGEDVTITVNAAQVRDVGGNLLDDENNTATEAGIGIAPTVDSLDANAAPLTMNLEFSESVDETTALTAANYALSGPGKGTLGTNPSGVSWLDPEDHTVVELSWSTGSPVAGQNVTVTVSNVEDEAGNVIGSPNSATDAISE